MKAILQKLVDRVDLSPAEVEAAFEAIFQGEATPAQMGAFLVGLRMKGETPAEAAARFSSDTRGRCVQGYTFTATPAGGNHGA